jgi:hypothetical protein
MMSLNDRGYILSPNDWTNTSFHCYNFVDDIPAWTLNLNYNYPVIGCKGQEQERNTSIFSRISRFIVKCLRLKLKNNNYYQK